MSEVWIVHRWVWGGGGDDTYEILGVYGSEATARQAADETDVTQAAYGGADLCEVERFEVQRPVVGV